MERPYQSAGLTSAQVIEREIDKFKPEFAYEAKLYQGCLERHIVGPPGTWGSFRSYAVFGLEKKVAENIARDMQLQKRRLVRKLEGVLLQYALNKRN